MNGPPEAFGSAYRLLAATVVPRPIAWVSSVSPAGRPNLAPYSFFNVVSVDPAVVMFAPVGTGEDRKDTAENVLATGECVIHVVTRDLAAAMNATSATVDPEVDEFQHVGLEAVPAETVDVPRVATARVAFECTLHEAVEVGASTLVLAAVEHAHVDDGLLTDGKPDVEKLDAVGRLSGSRYATTTDRFSLERPP